MSSTTTEQSAQPTHVRIDPVAMANEARALNDFLTTQSLRNANDAVILLRRVKELEAAADERAKIHNEEMTRITQERDQVLQMYESACQKIKDIQADAMNVQQQLNDTQAEVSVLRQPAISARKVKANG